MWTRMLVRARSNQFRSQLHLEELASRNSPSSLLNPSHDVAANSLDSDFSLDPALATKSTVIPVNRDTTTDPTKHHPADSGSSAKPKEPVTTTPKAGQTSQGPTTISTDSTPIPSSGLKVTATSTAKAHSTAKTKETAGTKETGGKTSSVHQALTNSSSKTAGTEQTLSPDISVGTSSVGTMGAPPVTGIKITGFGASENGPGLWTFSGTVSAATLSGNTVTLGGVPDVEGLKLTTNGSGQFCQAVDLKTDGSDDGMVEAIASTPAGQQSQYAYCLVDPSN